MAIRRELALTGLLLSSWLGCSDNGESSPAPQAQSGAGQFSGGAQNTTGGTIEGSPTGGSSTGGSSASGTTSVGGAPASGGISGAGGVSGRAGSGGSNTNSGAPAAADSGAGGEGFAPTEIPEHWWCDAATYGDGACNCGCGVLDPDCSDSKAESCELCDKTSCSPFGCLVDPDDNSQCPDPPSTWKCSPRLWRDGERCDCGCGAIDPDCDSPKLDACDKCDSPGSCASQECPAFVSPEYNGTCDQPPPPDGWTCLEGAYADGITCDCGCGVPDSDCRSDDFGTCVRCLNCGGHGLCEGTIDPEDMTQCAPPPKEWICSAEAFRDSICDCGCGLLDSYCQDTELLFVCANYPVEGCSAGNRAHIDPNHNMFCIITVPEEWTCDRAFYDDGFCDCGCGAQDLDCPDDDVDECDTCDSEGSCSSEACPGSIVADDTAHCTD